MSQKANAGNGMGCGGTLFLIFLVLKLLGLIAWSWWWVTAPLWAPAVLLILFIGAVYIFTEYTNHW